MKFTIGYLAFMTIIIMFLGTLGANKKAPSFDYSTISWEETRP